MKRTLLILILAAAGAVSASAQWMDFSSNERLDIGINVGYLAHNTPYARVGAGGFVNVWGFYADFLELVPQHHYDNTISDNRWEDDKAVFANVGYQVPVLPWLKVMPLLGYAQTNEGLTDGSTINIAGRYESSFYHSYTVTPGTRKHYFNIGAGLSFQPLRWLSINTVYTQYAIYGGIGINLMAFNL